MISLGTTYKAGTNPDGFTGFICLHCGTWRKDEFCIKLCQERCAKFGWQGGWCQSQQSGDTAIPAVENFWTPLTEEHMRQAVVDLAHGEALNEYYNSEARKQTSNG